MGKLLVWYKCYVMTSVTLASLKARTGLKITIMHYACGIQDTTINLDCLAFLFDMSLFSLVSW